jgi:hypothetical protein
LLSEFKSPKRGMRGHFHPFRAVAQADCLRNIVDPGGRESPAVACGSLRALESMMGVGKAGKTAVAQFGADILERQEALRPS